MGNFKELWEKANLLNQNPSLNNTNGLIVRICRELERFDPVVKTSNVGKIEKSDLPEPKEEKPKKKRRSRKKK